MKPCSPIGPAFAIILVVMVICGSFYEYGKTRASVTDEQWVTDDPDYIEPMFMRVKHFQMDLEAAGFDPCGIDGIYGPGTDRAWNEYETWYMERPVE